MWIQPKTDWTSSDYFNYTDYNRIINNIEHIRELAVALYPSFSLKDMESKSGYSDFPYADEFNLIESNLEFIKNHTYEFYISDSKTWYENKPTPNCDDLNRIESACVKMYLGLSKQLELKNRLSVRLGFKRGMVRS